MLRIALATPNGRTFSRSGFVLSLELLFVQQFSRPGKRLENGDKVWTNGKKNSVFFFKATTSALEVNFCFSFWSNLIQSRPIVCSVPEKSFSSSFLRYLLISYLITLSLKKEIIVLEKSLENVLDFGSKNLHEPW